MEKRAQNVQKFIDRIHGNLDEQINNATEKCESPIEELMAVALMVTKPHITGHAFNVVPQVRIKGLNYRVDFTVSVYSEAFVSEGDFECSDLVMTRFAVECDGHEWHSTKEQIKRDNERDIEILKNGVSVIHFPGSKINADPIECAKEVWTTLLSAHKLYVEEIECSMSQVLESVGIMKELNNG